MAGGCAWVTLATNDSYSLGALVLAHSLKQVGTKQQLAVLITPGVTGPMRTKLSEIFNVVKEVNILDSKDEANLKLLKRPELGITFTKLHCWRLTQYEKCVFLDADTLVLENCDELFEREELSAAPDIGWPDCFNSGVFVYRPSNDTHEKLIQFALEKGSFDGGDQGLLNLYFSDWAHKDISKHLPFIYNMSSTACYSYLPAFKQFGKNAKIIHFIGSSKPWLQYFNTETRKVHPSEGLNHLADILQLWWNIFCDLIHPKLSSDMTSHNDTVHGSQSYTSQNLVHTSYYHDHDHPSTSSNPNIAGDYQNVWDPWDEYDSRQSDDTSPDNIYSQSQIQHTEQSHSQIETYHVQEPDFETYQPENRPQEYHSRDSHIEQSQTYIEHQHSHTDQLQTYIEHHHSHTDHIQTYPEQQHHNNNLETHSHYHETLERHIQSHESHYQQNVIESHNTKAFSEAEHHDHFHHPSNSQPQPSPNIPSNHHEPSHSPSNHYEPPQHSIQDNSSNRPPPNDPRLPDDCVATTTVSNEITLQTDSIEDSNDDHAGLAGAFAHLTLGQARTPEQQALDDHLRRQGWEVGNIDYLGKDSFENIWSKICETLSEGTEKEPSPSKTEEKPVESAAELVAATTEKVQPSAQTPETAPLPAASPSKEAPKQVETTPPPPSEEPVKAPEIIPVSEPPKSAEPKPVEDKAVPLQETTTAASTETPTPVTAVPIPVAEAPVPAAVLATEKPASVPPAGTPEATTAATTPIAVPTAPAAVSEGAAAPTTPAAVSVVGAAPTTPTTVPEGPKSVPETPAAVSEATSAPITLASLPEAPVAAPEKPAVGPEAPAAVHGTPATVPETPVAITGTPVATPTPAAVSGTTAAVPGTTAAASETPVATPVTPVAVPETPVAVPETPAIASAAPSAVITAAAPTSKTPELSKSTDVSQTTTKTSSESTTPPTVPSTTSTEVPKPAETAKPTSAEAVKEVPKAPSVEAPKELPAAVPKIPAEAPKASGEIPTPSTESPKAPKEAEKKPEDTAQPPIAKVTEATPPTTPSTPPTPKVPEGAPAAAKVLAVDTSVPETPPPATTEAASPTPPPRKAGGAPKKSGGKKK